MVILFAIVSSLVVGCAAQASTNCFDYFGFTKAIGGHVYSWDLHQLCNSKADHEYYNSTTSLSIAFNIGGYALQTCAPGFPTYNTHGSAVMRFPGYLANVCNETSKTCFDYDLNTTTCCTGMCEVLVSFSRYLDLALTATFSILLGAGYYIC